MKQATFKTKKSEQTYERVLAAATRMFVERGYERTTMRDISRAGELGLGAVYYYFNSKEEIVLSFYERINRQVAEAFRGQAAPEAAGRPLAVAGRKPAPKRSTAEGFALLMRLKLEALEPHRDLMRVIMREAVDPVSPLCPLNAASHTPLDISVELFTEIAGWDGKTKAGEAAQVGRGLWLLHMGLLGYWMHDRSAGFTATRKAVESATALLVWTGRVAQVPGFGSLRKQGLAAIDALFAGRASSAAADGGDSDVD